MKSHFIVSGSIRVVDLALDQTGGHIHPLLEEELPSVRLGRLNTVVAMRPEGHIVGRIVAVDAKSRGEWIKSSPMGEEEADPDGSLDSIVIRLQPPANLGGSR